MTIVSKIGADINLRDMYECLEPSGDLVCIEYANNPKKGDNKKKPKKMMGGGPVRYAGNKKGGKGGQTRMAVKYR